MLREYANPGQIIENAEMIVYLASDPTKKYGLLEKDMWLEQPNSIIQYVVMRNSNCSFEEAINFCETEVPIIVFEDRFLEEEVEVMYLRYN